MLSYVVSGLASPLLVARFQRWCGVEEEEEVALEKEATADDNSNNNRSPVVRQGSSNPAPTATRLPPTSRPGHIDSEQQHRHHHHHHHHHAPVSADINRTSDCYNDISPPPLSCCSNGTAANGHVPSVVGDCCGSDRDLNHTGGGDSVTVSNGTCPDSLPSLPAPATHLRKRDGRAARPGDVSTTTTSQRDNRYPSSLSACVQGNCHSRPESSPCQGNCHPDSSPCPPTTSRQTVLDAAVETTGSNGAAFASQDQSECRDGVRKQGGSAATRVVIRYPLLYYWARLGATLGNEEFYLTGMPLLLWAVDAAVVRQTAVLWWAVMYVGQASKDYLGWPRPPCPPVLRLETMYLAEFSMPSTHAMAGTAIPLLLAKLLLQRYELPAVAVVGVAVLWCTTTCLSRLYLGVHTVLDVVCGVLLALVLFLLLSPIIPLLDHWQQTCLWAPLVLVPASLALCTVCYPSRGSQAAKGDAIIITAVLVGVGIGVWLNFHLGLSREPPATPLPMPVPVPVPTLGWLGMSLMQLVTGVAVVVVLKVVLKAVTVRFFRALFGPEEESVTLGYRYSTYLCLGLAIVFLDPLIFTALGFGRPGYYHEVV